MQSFRLFADISSNNARFTAHDYRAAGHRLIAIKATEGGGYINPRHAEWCRDAHRVGLRVLHYHYCSPPATRGDSSEAAFFWRVVKPTWRTGDLMAFDFEQTNGLDWAASRRYISRQINSLTTISGHHARLYASESFIKGLAPVGLVPGGLCWVAAWSSEKVALPGGLKVWARQYTDGIAGPDPHRFAGIGQCDGSVLNLRSALRLLARP